MLSTTLLEFGAKVELARFYSALKQGKLADLQGVSLQNWLERQVRHPHVRQFILAMARLTTYANAPEMVAASLILPLLKTQVCYLDGGWTDAGEWSARGCTRGGVKIDDQCQGSGN